MREHSSSGPGRVVSSGAFRLCGQKSKQLEVIESFRKRPVANCVIRREEVLSCAPPRCPRLFLMNRRWQTLHKRFLFSQQSFSLPPIVCSLNCLRFFCATTYSRAWCVRYVRGKKPMMKTITDVVFCVAMTQYYMDEQIFVEILFVSLEKRDAIAV